MVRKAADRKGSVEVLFELIHVGHSPSDTCPKFISPEISVSILCLGAISVHSLPLPYSPRPRLFLPPHIIAHSSLIHPNTSNWRVFYTFRPRVQGPMECINRKVGLPDTKYRRFRTRRPHAKIQTFCARRHPRRTCPRVPTATFIEGNLSNSAIHQLVNCSTGFCLEFPDQRSPSLGQRD